MPLPLEDLEASWSKTLNFSHKFIHRALRTSLHTRLTSGYQTTANQTKARGMSEIIDPDDSEQRFDRRIPAFAGLRAPQRSVLQQAQRNQFSGDLTGFCSN